MATVKPLKSRTMSLDKLQRRTLKVLKLVRKQMNRMPHEGYAMALRSREMRTARMWGPCDFMKLPAGFSGSVIGRPKAGLPPNACSPRVWSYSLVETCAPTTAAKAFKVLGNH